MKKGLKRSIKPIIRTFSYFSLIILLPLAAGLHFGVMLGDRIHLIEAIDNSRVSNKIKSSKVLLSSLKNSSQIISNQEIDQLTTALRIPKKQNISSKESTSFLAFKKIREIDDRFKAARDTESFGNNSNSKKNKYTLQYSSHQSKISARLQLKRLNKLNIPAFISSSVINRTTWYRVNIGKFSTTKSAKKFRKTLNKKSGITATFVRNINK